jgi:hypothetical protein
MYANKTTMLDMTSAVTLPPQVFNFKLPGNIVWPKIEGENAHSEHM